jgi:hypothetical protein
MKYGHEKARPIDEGSEEERRWEQEWARVNCWHDTYNAALNALYIRNVNSPKDMHAIAKDAADLAHGPL